MGAGEVGVGKSHRAFELVVALDDVRFLLPATICAPRHEATQRGPQAGAGDREIAAMQQPFAKQSGIRADATMRVASAKRDVPGARVAVEIWPLGGHFRKSVEILRVAQPAFGRCVRGDHGHATFERLRENARVG